jgi:hypothetical protein
MGSSKKIASKLSKKKPSAKSAAEHEVHEVILTNDTPPARADKILSGLLSGISRSRVQKALRFRLS